MRSCQHRCHLVIVWFIGSHISPYSERYMQSDLMESGEFYYFFGKQMYHPKHTCTRTCTHLHVYMHIYFQWIPDILKHQIKYQSMMILLHVQNRKIKIKSINLYVPLSYCLRAVLPKVVTRWPLPVVLPKVLVCRISRENWEKSKKFKKWNISMCETGVSTMSIIKTNHRNSLDIHPSLREAVYTRRPGFFIIVMDFHGASRISLPGHYFVPVLQNGCRCVPEKCWKAYSVPDFQTQCELPERRCSKSVIHLVHI